MAETRVQVAYHFKTDPAQLVSGMIRLPEQIIRTTSAGDEFVTEKVGIESLSPWDRDALRERLDVLVREATRTAQPAGSAPPAENEPAGIDDEISAF